MKFWKDESGVAGLAVVLLSLGIIAGAGLIIDHVWLVGQRDQVQRIAESTAMFVSNNRKGGGVIDEHCENVDRAKVERLAHSLASREVSGYVPDRLEVELAAITGGCRVRLKYEPEWLLFRVMDGIRKLPVEDIPEEPQELTTDEAGCLQWMAKNETEECVYQSQYCRDENPGDRRCEDKSFEPPCSEGKRHRWGHCVRVSASCYVPQPQTEPRLHEAQCRDDPFQLFVDEEGNPAEKKSTEYWVADPSNQGVKPFVLNWAIGETDRHQSCLGLVWGNSDRWKADPNWYCGYGDYHYWSREKSHSTMGDTQRGACRDPGYNWDWDDCPPMPEEKK